MFTLTGFGDEISPNLAEQLDLLESEGVKYLEFRGVWDKNVLDLSDEETTRVKAELDRRGFGVSAIASPIGKYPITEPLAPHLERFRRALDVAEFFAAPFMRVFSFYVPPRQAAEYRNQVMEYMSGLADAAKGRKVTLALENEHGLYGDLPGRSLDVIETLNSPQWTTCYDPCNYIMEGLHPFTQAFPLLADTIGYLHIKDGSIATRKICVAGEGDGGIPETLAALRKGGYNGFLSLEPHLLIAGANSGVSGPELFRAAIRALKGILATM
jgi:3-dehydroshikimate dehydratase